MDSVPYRAFCKAFEAMQMQSSGAIRERFSDKENRLGFEVITTPEGRGMAMIYDDKTGEVTIKIGPASEIRRRLTQTPNRRGRPKKMEPPPKPPPTKGRNTKPRARNMTRNLAVSAS